MALALWRRRFGTGPALGGLAANLASGGFLLLAVRAALVDAAWQWVALALLGSLLAHLADLYGRRPWLRPMPQRWRNSSGFRWCFFMSW